MRKFHIEATWRETGVQVQMDRIIPVPPEQAARMIERGILRADDEPVAREQIGEITITYPEGGIPKRVRRAALDWLTQHAGMTDDDTYELHVAVHADLEALARLEAAHGR